LLSDAFALDSLPTSGEPASLLVATTLCGLLWSRLRHRA